MIKFPILFYNTINDTTLIIVYIQQRSNLKFATNDGKSKMIT